VTHLNGSRTAVKLGINGEPAALGVDRAVGELRRGRAVCITDESRSALVAAVETIQNPLFRRLFDAAGGSLALLLTTERAEAAGLEGSGPGTVAIRCNGNAQLDELRAVGGMNSTRVASSSSFNVIPWTGSPTLAAAGFQLAKAGRLLPALIGFEKDDFTDASLVTVTVADIERHAGRVRHSLKRTSQSRVPLADAEESNIALFRDEHGLGEHVAVVIGQPNLRGVVPVRLHSACLTGDLLGSLRCDCGEQLRSAVARIAGLGGGVLLYLDQEGRGIGLANKLRAYTIQDTGLDTVDADRHLGFHADERNYDVAAALLDELGIKRIRLLTNNPQKISALREHGIEVVGRLPLVGSTNTHNERYLRAKRERSGHLVEDSSG
jgi:GTP cyclohydrolase II